MTEKELREFETLSLKKARTPKQEDRYRALRAKTIAEADRIDPVVAMGRAEARMG